MADANLMDTINQGGEVSDSMVLDTFMYANPSNSNYTGKDISYIANDICSRYENNFFHNGVSKDEYTAAKDVQTYLNSGHAGDLGSYVMYNHSEDLGGSYEGACAATFYKGSDAQNASDVYVAFRGTGEGRWNDNGDAFGTPGNGTELSDLESDYQRAAREYFDKTMGEMGVGDGTNLIVTGHSKGGNLAQYVTLASNFRNYIDQTFSLDGQGFSPEMVEYMNEHFNDFKAQCQKMFSISGDNDYVNVLGIKVIPEEHTVYIKSDCGVGDFTNSHSLYKTLKDGGKGNLFDYSTGKFFESTAEQRELALTAKTLSENIMKLDRETRGNISRSIMSALEVALGFDVIGLITGKTKLLGLKGEHASWKDIKGLIENIGQITSAFKEKNVGKNLLDAIIREKFGKVKDFFDGIIHSSTVMFICSAVEEGINGVKRTAEGIWNYVTGKISEGVDYIKDKGAKFIDTLKNYIGGVAHTAGVVATAIKNSFDGAVNAIKDFIDSKERILLDESAFSKAIQDFVSLKSDISALKADVEAALTALHNGFDTPAGEVFMNSCRNNLLEPIDREEKVITHISETLQQAKDKYTSVFTDYEHLTQTIASCQ